MTSDKETMLEQRLTNIESRLKTLETEIDEQGKQIALNNTILLGKIETQNTVIKVWFAAATLIGVIAAFYFANTLNKIDSNMVTGAGLTSAMTVLANNVADTSEQVRSIHTSTTNNTIEIEKIKSKLEK